MKMPGEGLQRAQRRCRGMDVAERHHYIKQGSKLPQRGDSAGRFAEETSGRLCWNPLGDETQRIQEACINNAHYWHMGSH